MALDRTRVFNTYQSPRWGTLHYQENNLFDSAGNLISFPSRSLVSWLPPGVIQALATNYRLSSFLTKAQQETVANNGGVLPR